MPSVLLVEDEQAIADSIAYALRREGFESHWTANGAAALEWLSGNHAALVILDVGLPDRSGFDLCREMRASRDTPVLFLTARSDEVDRILGLELGADDYMTKPFSPRELVARVKAILRRTAVGAPSPAPSNSPFVVDDARCSITFRGTLLDLTRYEFRLLRMLTRRPGRVFSREELMARVWESPEMSLERTIDTHVKTLRAKLRALDPNDDSIMTHRGFGYSLREPC